MKTQYHNQVISYFHSSTLDNPQVANTLHHKYMLHKNTPRLFWQHIFPELWSESYRMQIHNKEESLIEVLWTQPPHSQCHKHEQISSQYEIIGW
jgi:hypothetical protein